MTKPSKPPRPILLGDHVIYEPAGNKKLALKGVVKSEYTDNRLLVTTLAGHTWALKICNLTLCEDE